MADYHNNEADTEQENKKGRLFTLFCMFIFLVIPPTVEGVVPEPR